MDKAKPEVEAAAEIITGIFRLMLIAAMAAILLSCFLSMLNVKSIFGFGIPDSLRENFNYMYILAFVFVLFRRKPWEFFLILAEKTEKILGRKEFFPVMSAVMLVIYLFSAGSLFLSLRLGGFADMMERVIYNSYNGNFLFYDVTQKSYLAEHFSFAPLYFVPVHFLFRSTLSVLIACVLLLWGGGLMLRAILKTEGHADPLVNFICLIYFNSRIIISNMNIQFEQLIIPLVFLTYLAYLKKWNVLYIFSFIVLLTIKEDISLYMAGFGIYVLIRERRYYTGGLTFLASIIWFFMTFFVFIPHFAGDSGYKFLHNNYSAWGGSISGAAGMFITHPFRLLSAMLNPVYLLFFLSMALLPFFDFCSVLIFINAWVVLATSSNVDQATMSYYYGFGLFAFSVIAATIGLKSVFFRQKTGRSLKFAMAAFVIVLNVGWFNFVKYDPKALAYIKTIGQIPAGSTVTAGYFAGAYVKKDAKLTKWTEAKAGTDYVVLTWDDVRQHWLNAGKILPKEGYVNLSKIDKNYIFEKLK